MALKVIAAVLLGVVIFLLWERSHYKGKINRIYDIVRELATGLEPGFEIRSHPELRRYFTLDSILDDIEAKLERVRGVRNREE